MSLPHSSIATIDSPEFINLQPLDISPNMSKCDIKVFYLGKNRNGSFIGKEVASNMAKTLRGAPIVGYYKPEKDDFSDHAEQIILDDEGVHFKSLTFPYGFVAPDAEVWFQKFNEQDDFGNPVVREYLMTTGYLWTGVYPEAGVVFRDGGKPQSMELDEETINGHWATDYNDNVEFFIINDAIISKLCILGDSVEPCFEGASVTESKEVRTSYTLDDTFKKTLFDMMKELEFALKGGNFTVNNDNAETMVTPIEEQAAIEPSFSEESPVVEAPQVEEPIVDEFSEDSQDNPVQENFEENQDSIENPSNSSDFTQDNKEDDEKDEDPEDEPNPEDDDEKEPETKNSLHTDEEYAELEGKYSELEGKYNLLVQEIDDLRNFKLSIENQQKDELIASFTMLSDEDKKDVIENKTKYTLDDIKAKLAVICFDKKVNFVDNTPQEADGIVTYNLEHQEDDSTVPDWIKAVEETQKRI